MSAASPEPETVAEFVTRTRLEQGLPRRLEDPALIEQVVRHLLAGRNRNAEGPPSHRTTVAPGR